jgi:diguanylate cyclase (GGDEF)-like protein
MSEFVELPIILLVSHNNVTIAFLKSLLKDNFHLIVTENKYEAMEFLETNEVGAIIVQEELLLGDPFLFVAQARKIPSYRHAPFLLITTNLKKTYTDKAKQAGYTAFLFEPLEEGEVRKTIGEAIAPLKTRKKLSTLRPAAVAPATNKSRSYSYDAFLNTLSKTKRVGLPACLLLISEDQFQKIVEKRGKLFGVKLLKQIRSFLKKHLRAADLLHLQKDGTFLLILPKTSRSAGKAIADSIRHDVEDTLFKIDSKDIAITLSIGLVFHEDKAHPAITAKSLFENLFSAAEGALDFAKQKGNRIAFSSVDQIDHYEILV